MVAYELLSQRMTDTTQALKQKAEPRREHPQTEKLGSIGRKLKRD